MSINGALSDIGFVSLLQFPNSTRKTGLLTLLSIHGKAEFYYRQGSLVHARYGQKTGRDVLIDLVDWNDGQFVFEPDLEIEETTIQDDLHHILLWALKEKDKKKKSDHPGESAVDPAELDAELSEKLDELLELNSGIKYIFILSSSGQFIARSTPPVNFLQNIDPFMKSITSYITEYPEHATGKTFMETDSLSVAVSGIDKDQTVVIATGPDEKLGRLAIVLVKIIRELRRG